MILNSVNKEYGANVLMVNCKISGGRNNTLIIGKNARLRNCSFIFFGEGNTLRLIMVIRTELWKILLLI